MVKENRRVLVVIDIQNEITKNYKGVIGSINKAIDWAVNSGVPIVYTRHENLSPGSRVLKPGTAGAELATDLKVVSKDIFVKNKANCLTCEPFVDFIEKNGKKELILVGADATICVKSTCFNLRKQGYEVVVLADCIASWKMSLIPEMLEYYKKQGARVVDLVEFTDNNA